MNNIVEINNDNIFLLQLFLDNTLPNTFRYYCKRDISIIKNHILTILLIINEKIVGYAHIDHDENKSWFGICIIDEYQSKGYGRQLMNYVFNHEKIKNLEVYLTVDLTNLYAIKLYINFGFKIVDETKTYYLMKYINIFQNN